MEKWKKALCEQITKCRESMIEEYANRPSGNPTAERFALDHFIDGYVEGLRNALNMVIGYEEND